MKFIFSFNKTSETAHGTWVGNDPDNPHYMGHWSLAFEAIQRASRIGPTEFYCNPGPTLELGRKVLGESVTCFELEHKDHGFFWPAAKFRAILATSAAAQDKVFHLDLDMMLYEPVDTPDDIIVSGLEFLNETVPPSGLETIYSLSNGEDSYQRHSAFYLEAHEAARPEWEILGYAFNCAIIGGRANILKDFAQKTLLEVASTQQPVSSPNPSLHGFPGAKIADYKLSCLFEQANLAAFCAKRGIKVGILPMTPADYTSPFTTYRRVNAPSERPGLGGWPIRPWTKSHHHLNARFSELVKREIKMRSQNRGAARFGRSAFA